MLSTDVCACYVRYWHEKVPRDVRTEVAFFRDQWERGKAIISLVHPHPPEVKSATCLRVNSATCLHAPYEMSGTDTA